MSKVQPVDFRTAVITGSSAGVTGGELIPAEFEGIIHDISYAEVSNTGQNVALRTQPSGVNLDVKALTPLQSLRDIPNPGTNLGKVARSNVLQVVTSQASVVVKVVYTVEYGRFA